MKTVYFDDTIRNRFGKRAPFYDTTHVNEATDGDLRWFHTRYGMMHLYRLHEVDSTNFIAEDLHIVCRTSDERWHEWSENPLLALA